jgi:hypothetical protein
VETRPNIIAQDIKIQRACYAVGVRAVWQDSVLEMVAICCPTLTNRLVLQKPAFDKDCSIIFGLA